MQNTSSHKDLVKTSDTSTLARKWCAPKHTNTEERTRTTNENIVPGANMLTSNAMHIKEANAGRPKDKSN